MGYDFGVTAPMPAAQDHLAPMPYRFKLDDSLRRGFRRIAREQIELALGELNSETVPTASIHASRKAMKRLRALIRSAAPAMGSAKAAKHDKAVRDIARQLSRRRDADVCLETVGKLEVHFGDEGVAVLRPLRTYLDHSLVASARLDAGTLTEVRALLAKEGQRLGKLRLRSKGFEAIISGIENTYRMGQEAYKAASRFRSDKYFHELRKAVQAHWRQMALLSRAWPDEFAVRVSAARELSQLLGDDHDIAILKLAAAGLDKAAQRIVCNLCQRRQKELRDDVRPRIDRLYSEPPKAFARRMDAYWKTGRRLKAAAATVEAAAGVKSVKELSAPVLVGSQSRLAAKTPG